MLNDDLLTNPRLSKERSGAEIAQFVIEKFLYGGAIFLPPPSDGRHVMRGGCADRQVGASAGWANLTLGFFGHTLDLQTQNAQLIHYRRHRIRHHTQVFSANEHIAGRNDGR